MFFNLCSPIRFRNAISVIAFARDIATKDKPRQKSNSPNSITTLLRVIAGLESPDAPTGPKAEESPQHHAAWGLGEPDSGYPNLGTPETRNRQGLPEPPQPGD